MTDTLPLAGEFPPASAEQWRRLVDTVLKGRSFETLGSATYDGLPIAPLYQRAAAARPVAARPGPWQVVQRVEHPDPTVANAEALHDLENGATGLSLVFAGAVGDHGFGLPATDALARVLDGVQTEAGIGVALDLPPHTSAPAFELMRLVKARGLQPEALDIRMNIDPIGALAFSGHSDADQTTLLLRFAARIPELAAEGFRCGLASADGRVIHNAGGSEAQELAFVLATMTTYLRWLEGAGMPLDLARRLIAFRLVADADQFMTIAKFRAVRKLWARVEETCLLAPQPVFVQAETAWRMLTQRDAYVNMLRTTVAVAAAGLGGADAIGVLPFTAAIGLPDHFARRIARNTQLMLLEESHLAKVGDPAAGSGAVEDLTTRLCHAAWTQLQEIEAAGGVIAALQSGMLQGKVAAVRAAREDAVAHRKDALTGTSDFPHLAEDLAPVLMRPGAKRGAAMQPGGLWVEPLAPTRLAAPFEALRDASDRALAATGARPKVFLANLGAPADFVGRANFAKSLFEAGGVEAVTNDGFEDHAALINAFKASGAPLACLCSSDAVYARDGAAAARALKAAGASVYLAGRPPKDAPLTDVHACIFSGCDALALLRAAHAFLGLQAGP
jgi:methylmalonyl-CoA mutase